MMVKESLLFWGVGGRMLGVESLSPKSCDTASYSAKTYPVNRPSHGSEDDRANASGMLVALP